MPTRLATSDVVLYEGHQRPGNVGVTNLVCQVNDRGADLRRPLCKFPHVWLREGWPPGRPRPVAGPALHVADELELDLDALVHEARDVQPDYVLDIGSVADTRFIELKD